MGDKRLEDRLVQMVAALAEHPEASIPQACGDWWDTKAAYNFWNNDRVECTGILSGHRQQTIARAAECPVVLAIQDTMELNLTHHPATRGLGYLSHPSASGLLTHSLLAVSSEGTPLGLLAQWNWIRDPAQLGKRHQRKSKPTADKESQRWLNGLRAAQEALPAHPCVMVVGDSEADVFDLFAAQRSANTHLLVRICREQRRVDDPAGSVRAALQASAPRGELVVEVPRADGRRARQARLQIRREMLRILPPRSRGRSKSAQLQSIGLQFIQVEEVDAPPGVKPIRWVLATTLPLDDWEAIVRCVGWYALRWRIERFHYVLKSGCQIEKRELETVERMQRALTTFSIVAWRLLWLTYAARQNPDAPCDTVLEAHEWQSLYATIHQTTNIPSQLPSLREAIRMIARLGGFLARKRDGEPGVKTLWRGMCRLHDISQTWKLLTTSPPRAAPKLVGNA